MPIDWQRARSIFDYPKPPHKVTERQFDYFDDELRKLATTPYGEIDFGDLWYYHHDLAYVTLQPEVFAYLFPVCLMDWHDTLMANESCSHGDSEFHYGLRQGNVLAQMATASQRDEITKFFRDSFLERIDAERGLAFEGKGATAYGWMARFNSLGIVLPIIPDVWEAWWSLETVGRAIAAIQYLSGFMYFDGENPVFTMWTRERGGGGPYLWGNDTFIHDAGWLPENTRFLKDALTFDFVKQHLSKAALKLHGESEQAKAQQVADDVLERKDIIEARTTELPILLASKSPQGWTI
jgi:hypothetical protein